MKGAPSVTPENVSMRRAAELLQVSEATIRRMVNAGDFAGAFKCGRQIRIPVSDLKAYKRDHLLNRGLHR
jgi:excisionase family DNA binding protein